jgi:hypothetical protein
VSSYAPLRESDKTEFQYGSLASLPRIIHRRQPRTTRVDDHRRHRLRAHRGGSVGHPYRERWHTPMTALRALTTSATTTSTGPTDRSANSHQARADKRPGARRQRYRSPEPSAVTGSSTNTEMPRNVSRQDSPHPQALRMTYWRTPWPACYATRSSMKRARATMAARKRLVACWSISGRRRQPSSGAASCRPTSSIGRLLIILGVSATETSKSGASRENLNAL